MDFLINSYYYTLLYFSHKRRSQIPYHLKKDGGNIYCEHFFLKHFCLKLYCINMNFELIYNKSHI